MEPTLEQIKNDSISLPKGICYTQIAKINLNGHVLINITDLTFTAEDIDLLNKGLSFSPNPTKHSVADLWLDFKRFERSLLLKHHFHNSPPKEMYPLYSFK